MKKIQIVIFLVLMQFQLFSSNFDLFSYDKEKLEMEFTELNEIEDYVIVNNYPAYFEVSNKLELQNFQNIDLKNPLGTQFFDEMDWGAFAWGFCCCPVGFFVVAINKEKDDLAKESYWTGVIVSTILNLISTAFSNTYYYTY